MTNIFKNIVNSLIIIFLVSGIIYAASILDLKSWDPLTKEKWDTLVTEIETLKAQVSNSSTSLDALSSDVWTLNTQVTNISSNLNNLDSEVETLSTQITDSSAVVQKIWTVTAIWNWVLNDVTPYKPITITVTWNTAWDRMFNFHIVSWADTWYTWWISSLFWVRSSSRTYYQKWTTPSFTIIPTSSTVTIYVEDYKSWTQIYAYQ